MDAHNFFLQLLIILLAARILGEAVARLKIPAVIGEICAGILIGPSILGWLKPDETIRLLAEIGIILLLFEVGIETDLSKLMQARIKSLVAAIAGVIVPLVCGFAVSFWAFNLSLLVSLFIGGALTATSIAGTTASGCSACSTSGGSRPSVMRVAAVGARQLTRMSCLAPSIDSVCISPTSAILAAP